MAKKKQKYFYTPEQKFIKRVNERLVRLEHDNIDSYAQRLLKERLTKLGLWTKKGRAITAYQKLDEDTQKKFFKALKMFEKSETSTRKGAKNIQKYLRKAFKTGFKDITDSEERQKQIAHAIQTLFEVEDLEDFIKKFDPSNFWEFITEAAEKEWNLETFTQKFISNFNITDDLDLRRNLYRVYEEFVK